MPLRAIHDFELALLDPCLAMAERGIRIDEARRQRMIADIDAARAPLETETTAFVCDAVLPKYAERLNGAKAHLFRARRVCACCRNGKAKRAACWSCAGYEKSPTKKQLAERGPRWQLEPCEACAGAGASETVVFNPASPEQVRIVLYELLRLPPRTKDGKLTADERALKSLLAEATDDAREFIRKLLRLGKLDTIRAVLERIKPGPDGRIRAVYNPAGTETGRFAASETFLIESTNLNNMPKKEVVEPMFDVRRCFVPDDGMVFVEADLSGAEAWVTAAAAGDVELLDLMRSGLDVHKWTASRIFGKPIEEVTPQERHIGKTARHALNYGMQWKTFMENVNFVADRTGVAITARQAKQVCDGYHRLHPKLELWWRRIQANLVATRKLTTCFGRTRTFYGRNAGEWLGETHREYIAQESQSTIADLLNRGLLRWWRQHDGKVGELLAQVYDSMLIQVPRAKAQLCAQLVQRCMTEEIEVHGIRITVPVDVKICESWAVLKEAA